MSERQGKVGRDREARRCTLCGAKAWLKDHTTGQFSGPWHFADCPEVPGGEDLSALNIEARMRYEAEAAVPKEQGMRIMRAIYAMMASQSAEVMLARKAAIQEELKKL